MHDGHRFKNMSVREFTDCLAREMVENTLDADADRVSPPTRATQVRANGAKRMICTAGLDHVPVQYGYKSIVAKEGKRKGEEVKYQIQHTCKMCGVKSGTYCRKCGKDFPCCKDGIGKGDKKRYCMTRHRTECREQVQRELGESPLKRR